jgi:glyoxylase-like metal-dependent hydrolase (beta-lactamase superfamily II)
MSVDALQGLDIVRVRAENPGPYTLSGTNTWVVGRDPAWVIDPGPELGEHLDNVAAEVEARGGAGGIAVTHDHGDHVEGLLALRERLGRPRVGARRYAADVRLGDGDRFGPLAVHSVPGHAPDHLAFVWDGACFTGDAVLGEGSVFVAQDLGEYLEALQRLRQLPLKVICPGHGPPVWDPKDKLDEYLAHRAERERKLLEALDDGLREEDELLDAVWADAPPALRPAAAVTLGAHREKLRAEGRWPRPGGAPPAP